MEEKKKRLFIAIELPDAVVQEVIRVQQKFKREDLFEGRYIKSEHVHITPKFIGEVKQNQIADIVTALGQIKCAPYHAQLGGVDLFAAGNKVKVVYINVIVPGLVQLVQQLDAILAPWVAPEDRSFVGHITLARVKKVKNNERLLGFVRRLNIEPIEFTINSFVLKESVLTPQGPEHTIIKEYKLQ